MNKDVSAEAGSILTGKEERSEERGPLDKVRRAKIRAKARSADEQSALDVTPPASEEKPAEDVYMDVLLKFGIEI